MADESTTVGGPGSGGAGPRKVTLTKNAPTVSLTKRSTQLRGEMRVNLNWNPRPAAAPGNAGGGFLKRLVATALEMSQASSIDLDLACLYELVDGTKGVVQALGNSFTSSNTGKPIISLDGDDRTGASTGGENLRIDLSRADEIRRILIFAFIYQGAPNWADANGIVTLFPPGDLPIEVRLDESDPGARTCAIAMVETVGASVSVRREVRYINGGQDALDRAYAWGLQWAPGHK